MSERKKLKLEKNVEEAKKRLEMFKNLYKTAGPIQEPEKFVDDIRKWISELGCKETCPYSVLGISEIFRMLKDPIEAFSMLMNDTELTKLFISVYNCIVDGKFDMSSFPLEVFFINFVDNELISKFFDLYPKSGLNRPAMKQILAFFVKFSKDNEALISRVVNDYKRYLDLIPLITQYIDISKLDENTYAAIFCECQFFRQSVEFREVRGRNKMNFVQCAVETHPSEVFAHYSRDRDQRIRLILAKRVSFTSEPYFSILINDPEEAVRLTLLKRMSWVDAPLQVSSRALDRAADVRSEVFRIFEELVYQLRVRDVPGVFDVVKKSEVENGKLMFKNETTDVLVETIEDKFYQFFSSIAQGCLTCFRNEYIQIIAKCGFSLDFFSRQKSTPGLYVYFKTLAISTLDNVPSHLWSFCLEYIFKGDLSISRIRECIQKNIFEVLKHVSDPAIFYDQLLEKLFKVRDFESMEIIAETIKPILKDQRCIRWNSKDEPHMDSTVLSQLEVFTSENLNEKSFRPLNSNELFINAHTMMDESAVDKETAIVVEEAEYPVLYFMAYKRPEMLFSGGFISKQIDITLVVHLLVYVNNTKYIEPFVDQLLKYDLDFRTFAFLTEGKTLTASLVYFYCTGQVRIPQTLFFITAIKCALRATNETRITQIFKKYMQSIPQTVFNHFHSICTVLKTCTVTEKKNDFDGSLVLNPAIISAEISVPKDTATSQCVCLSKREKMLWHICNSVISSRDGVDVDIKFNPNEHGFYQMTENELQLISLGQVTYDSN